MISRSYLGSIIALQMLGAAGGVAAAQPAPEPAPKPTPHDAERQRLAALKRVRKASTQARGMHPWKT